MTRPLADVEAEATLRQKRRESFDRIVSGRLSPHDEELERERLMAIGHEMAMLEAKSRPPPAPRVYSIHELWKLTPAEAAAKAAAIRADPRFFDPTKPDANGVRLNQAEYALLVQGHSELLARAATPPDANLESPEAAAASQVDHSFDNAGRR